MTVQSCSTLQPLVMPAKEQTSLTLPVVGLPVVGSAPAGWPRKPFAPSGQIGSLFSACEALCGTPNSADPLGAGPLSPLLGSS
eukprot:15476156-Alexandrium_andersonii.AAC.1